MLEFFSESMVPLIFLLPLWFVLIRIGKILESLNKGKFGKKALACIDAVSSTRLPLFLFSLVLYARHLIDLSVDKSHALFFFGLIDGHLYYFTSLTLLSHVILKFSDTYKRDLIATYTKEEMQYSNCNRSSEKTQLDAAYKVIKGVWISITSISLLDHFGVPASSILAFGGMGSLVIGFAAKDLLGDILSGVLLYFDKQFNIGDWIKVESPSLEGTVEAIGWRVSKIKTFDNRPVYVPNKFLGSAIIQNVSRRESMRFKETLTLDLSAMPAVDDICREIRESVFLNHDDIDASKSIIVNLSGFTGGVINVYMSAHTRSIEVVDYYNITQDFWLKIYRIITHHNAKVAPPFHEVISRRS